MAAPYVSQFYRLVGWLFLISGLFCSTSHAQTSADGYLVDVDNGSFGPRITRIAQLPDGKVLVAGDFETIRGEARRNIARLMPDGRVDLSFDTGTGPAGQVNDFVLLPDGDIVIAGNFFNFDGNLAHGHIARLNDDGSLDTDFTLDEDLDAGLGILAMARQSDGNLVISINGAFPRLERLDPDGLLDPTFVQPNVSNDTSEGVHTIAVDAADRIIIGGSFTTVEQGSVSRNRIARLRADGSLDTTFDVGTGASRTVFSVLADIDGKIYIGGSFTSINNIPRQYVARLLQDGSVDADYVPNIDAQFGRVFSMALQPDGQLLFGGDFQDTTVGLNRLSRLDLNGQIDTDIEPPAGNFGNVLAIAVQDDGQILFGANQLLRLNSTGELDVDFDPQSGPDANLSAMSWQTPADYLIGGDFSQYNNVAQNRIARVTSSGAVDNTFVVGSGPNGAVGQLTVGLDREPLVAGDFTEFDLQATDSLARLTVDGALDTGFMPDFGSTGVIKDGVVLPSGEYLVVGTFTQVDGVSRNRIARLNADGTLDTTFDPGAGANGPINAIEVISRDRLWIGGDFTEYDGEPRGRLAKLLAAGQLDSLASLTPNVDGAVLTMALQSDEDLLIGGRFASVGATARRGLARIALNRLDESFDAQLDVQSGTVVVNSIQPQVNGKILIGGNFNTAQEQPIDRIARLNEDGSPDPDFENSFGAAFANGDTAIVNELALLPNGKVLVHGEFDTLGGLPRNRVGRVLLPDAVEQTVSLDNGTVSWTPGGSLPVPSGVRFSTSSDGINFSPVGSSSFPARVDGVWQQTRVWVDVGIVWIRVTPKFDPHGQVSFTHRIRADAQINILTGGSFDFGSVKTGERRQVFLNVRNDGDARLEITGFPDLTEPFSFDPNGSCGDLPIRINPAASCLLGFAFTPPSGASFSQTFQITSNSVDAPTTFTLNGTGIDPELTITPNTVEFGSQPLGTTSISQTVVLSNEAQVDLELLSIPAIDPPFDTSADNCRPTPVTLAPGTSCQLDVFFQPEQAGPVSEQIGIDSDAADSPANLTLNGNGTQPLLVVQPSELVFGERAVDTVSGELVSVLRNTGDADLLVTGVTSLESPFVAATNTCGDAPFTLVPTNECQLGFQFAPTAEGPALADLVITSNAPTNRDGLRLTGTGLIAELAVDPASIDFGDQMLGITSVARTVTVTSTGLADLLVDGIEVTGNAAADFALNGANDLCTHGQLPTGDACTFTLEFTPSESGIRHAEAVIDTNAIDGTDRIQLLGTNDVLFFDGFGESQ